MPRTKGDLTMHYFVVSPNMERIDPVTDYGEGPIISFQCCCCVEAESKRDAKTLAVRHKDMQEWVKEQREDRRNPFSGLTVTKAKCEHGICSCDIEGCTDRQEYCPKCDKELETISA